jgi:hypothetical protein
MTYTITHRITFEGFKLWGFELSNGNRQKPNWDCRRDAVAAAKAYIAQGGW